MHPRFRPLAAAVAAACAAAMHASAQSQPQPQPLPPLSVTAPREAALPAPGAALSAAEIAARRPYLNDAAQLLSDLPGVSLNFAGGFSSLPAIHGLADDRLRIKVDGMDLLASCPNHMNPPLSYLDPAQVQAVGLWAGIAPVSVGGDAIGGTIAVETAAPAFAEPGQGTIAKGEVSARYRGNEGAAGGSAFLSLSGEWAHIHYSGAAAQADNRTAGGDFKTSTATGRPGHTLPLDEVGSTAFKTRNHALGLAFRTGPHLVEAKLGYQDAPYQLFPNQRMDMLGNTQHRASVRYRGQADWGTAEVRAYRDEVDHRMDFGPDRRYWYGSLSQPPAAPEPGTACAPLGSACAAGMPMYSAGRTTGAGARANIAATPADLLRVGAEAQRYRLDDWWPASGGGMWPGTFVNIADGRRDRDAVFGEWERRLDARWLALAGVRYERVRTDAGEVRGYDPTTNGMGAMPSWQRRDAAAFNARDRARTDGNWDATALARYVAGETLEAEAGIARKVRTPNLYERYTWSTWSMAAAMNNTAGDGNGYIGNMDLEPEAARTISATVDWHAPDRAWEVRFTPYLTRVAGFVDAVQWDAAANAPVPVPVAGRFVVLKYVNQSARLQGFDLSGRAPLAKGGFGELDVKGVVAYVDGTNETTGDGLYSIMPLNARLTLTHARGGWAGGVEVQAVRRKGAVSAMRNEVATPGYALVNLRGSYAWKQLRLDFGVDNLFDRLHRLPTGGAYVGQGTTMSLNGVPWGVAMPGTGRSLYAGATLKF